jgi:hypothetical protein
VSILPSELPGDHQAGKVSLLGHKVSTDAVLIAGASLIGILVLWRMAKPGAPQAVSLTPTFAGDGATFASPPMGSPISSSMAPATPAPARVAGQLAGGQQGIWLHTQANAQSPVGAILQPGQMANAAGAPISGGSFTSAQLGVTGNQWEPVSVGGSTYFAFLPEVSVQ